MGIKDITVNKLYRISKSKPMICFGAGEIFMDMFRQVETLHMEENVICVIDNDKTKWNSYISIDDTRIPIKSIDFLQYMDIDRYTMVIATKKYNEVYIQLQKKLENKEVNCYKYPIYRDCLCKMMRKIAKKIPLRNYILLRGQGDTCENAKAIGDYIREHDYLKKYKLVWLCDDPSCFKETKKEKYIGKNTCMSNKSYVAKWKYYYYKVCARYLMFENEIIEKERVGQISVYMNHGAPPIKSTIGHIALPENIDYVVCPSENVADIVSKQYGVNKEKLLYCGSPRTDIFFSKKQNLRLKSMLEINKYNKVILWAPTFRSMKKKKRVDSLEKYPYGVPAIYSQIDYDKIIKVLREKNVLLLIKPHIYQDMSKWCINTNDNIRLITQKELDLCEGNVYEMMMMVDSLITDYSTIAFDYMLLNRTIGYTIDDMDKYIIGFSVPNPLDYMPGFEINSSDQFVEYIKSVCEGNDEMKERRNILNKYINQYQNDNCERLLTKLELL